MRYVLWVLGIVGLLAGCAPAPALIPTPMPPVTAAPPQVIHIACPESLVPAMMALASAYQQHQQTTQLHVMQRADPLALQALRDRDADLAALTWLPPAQADDVWATPFARDGLAVVVNPQNGLPGLTLDQLQRLYRGQLEDWQVWGGLPGAPQIISREEAAGDFRFFQARVMRENRVGLTAIMAPTTQAVIQFVNEDALAIGYLSTAHLHESVRAVAIAEVPPSREAIAAGLYPLTRELFLVTSTEPDGALRDFVQWTLSNEGQQILSTHRYLPLP